jgi:hypothetical protein
MIKCKIFTLTFIYCIECVYLLQLISSEVHQASVTCVTTADDEGDSFESVQSVPLQLMTHPQSDAEADNITQMCEAVPDQCIKPTLSHWSQLETSIIFGKSPEMVVPEKTDERKTIRSLVLADKKLNNRNVRGCTQKSESSSVYCSFSEDSCESGSDSEYVPSESIESSGSSSDESDVSVVNNEAAMSQDSVSNQAVPALSDCVVSSSSGHHRVPVTSGNERDISDEVESMEAEARAHQSMIRVIRTNNAGGSRKRDKKAYCFFCGLSQSHIVRHWGSVHRSEREVQIIMLAKKETKQIEILRLRNMGNHLHNCSVVREGQGDFLVTYRPTNEVVYTDYVPCDACFAYIQKRELWRHRCKLKSKTKGRVAANAALLLPSPAGMSSQLHLLIDGMQNAEFKIVIRNDEVISSLALKLLDKVSMKKKAYVRQQVILLARLLLEMKQKHNVQTLTDCICPGQFRNVVQSVKSIAGFDEKSGRYRVPTTALKIGHLLKKCARIVKTSAIMKKDRSVIEDTDYFVQLCESEWTDEISSNALKTVVERRRNKVQLLPLSEDVAKLHKLLQNEITTYASLLETCCDANSEEIDVEKTWRNLASAILAQLITFNRRRSGEVSRMTVQDFRQRTKSSMSSDAQQALEPLERSLCKLFTRVEIEGKRGRTVPVLLKTETEKALELLEKMRSVCGVKENNEYMFAMPNSDNFLRGHDSIRMASIRCGARNPESLRSTNLRKHVATMCQMIDLKENELDLLAQFMGHSIQVHRNFYRLPENTLQSAMLAKLFLSMENGTLVDQKGKTLQDLLVQMPEEDLSKL